MFISSEAGVQPPTNMVHYGMTKTAVLARGFAQALAGSGVTVNSVLAGPTLSDGVLAMWDTLYPGVGREEQEARFVADGRVAGSLLGRVLRPDEVTYLASDFSSGTAGRALGVDGGLVPTILP